MPDQSVDGREWSITYSPHGVGVMRASIGADILWTASPIGSHRMWAIQSAGVDTPVLTAVVSGPDVDAWLHHLISHELLARKVLAAQPDSSAQ